MAEHEQYYLSQHDTHLILGQLRCVLEESPIRQAAREDLLHIMRDLGATSDHAGQIADKILQQFDGVFRGELSLFDAEKALHRSFSDIAITHGGEPTTVMNRLNAVFEERIETIVKQLSPVMIPLSALDGKILDIGSGNGKLARHLEKEFGVSILGYDLIGTPRSENNVEVRAYDGQHIPETDKAFKAVLMINLLHHVEDPNVLLKEAARLSDRVIIIETVPRHEVVVKTALNISDRDHYQYWETLRNTPEMRQELLRTFFQDYMSNRVFRGNAYVPVPGKFMDNAGWLQAVQNLGFTIADSVQYGTDMKQMRGAHSLLLVKTDQKRAADFAHLPKDKSEQRLFFELQDIQKRLLSGTQRPVLTEILLQNSMEEKFPPLLEKGKVTRQIVDEIWEEKDRVLELGDAQGAAEARRVLGNEIAPYYSDVPDETMKQSYDTALAILAVRATSRYVLADGRVSEEEAAYVMGKILSDGRVDPGEAALLSELIAYPGGEHLPIGVSMGSRQTASHLLPKVMAKYLGVSLLEVQPSIRVR